MRRTTAIAGVAGCMAGLLDLAAATFEGRPTAPPGLIAQAAITSACVVSVGFALGWLAVGRPLSRRFGLDEPAAAAATALGGGLMLTLMWTLSLSALLLDPYWIFISIERGAETLLAALFSTVVSIRWYHLTRDRTSAVAIMGPVATTELVVLVCVSDFVPLGPIVSALVGALAGALAVEILGRVRRRQLAGRRLSLALALLVAFSIAIPAVSDLAARVNGPTREAPSDASGRVKRVLLLTVDTLRADALAANAEGEMLAPNLVALGDAGVVFEEALSPAPWTLPAVSSILTGVSPRVHRTVRMDQDHLPESLPLIPEAFRQAGYRTAAIGSNTHLTGFDRGFDDFEMYPQWWRSRSIGLRLFGWLSRGPVPGPAPSSPELTDLAVRWLDAHPDEPAFLWLHYFDPHVPYEPPVEYWPEGEPPPGLGHAFALDDASSFSKNAEEQRWVRALYEAEVREVDHEIGRLLAALRARGLEDETLIVFTSDHGEEFWEHGRIQHGHTLYDELVHVPLIVKGPGIEPGLRVDHPVSTRSIANTLFTLAGIEALPTESPMAPGLVVEEAAAAAGEDPAVYSGGVLYFEDRESVVFDGYKFIRSVGADRAELYDRANDPEERHPITDARPDLVARGHALLDAEDDLSDEWARTLGIERPGRDALDLSRDEAEQLRQLGYLP